MVFAFKNSSPFQLEKTRQEATTIYVTRRHKSNVNLHLVISSVCQLSMKNNDDDISHWCHCGNSLRASSLYSVDISCSAHLNALFMFIYKLYSIGVNVLHLHLPTSVNTLYNVTYCTHLISVCRLPLRPTHMIERNNLSCHKRLNVIQRISPICFQNRACHQSTLQCVIRGSLFFQQFLAILSQTHSLRFFVPFITPL